MFILQPYVPPSTLSRQLTRIAQSSDLAEAHVTAIAEVEAAKVDALQQIADRAMQGVAQVSQLEQQLAQVVPIAASQLQVIGDMHAVGTADVLAETPHRLR